MYNYNSFLRSALGGGKKDVSENLDHNRAYKINCYVWDNLAMSNCLLGINGQKRSSNLSDLNKSTFTVCYELNYSLGQIRKRGKKL